MHGPRRAGQRHLQHPAGLLGVYYVNNFNEYGRTWQVNVQAEPRFRCDVTAIKQLQVRNSLGADGPPGTLLDVRDTSGPVMVMRYNLYSAAAINGTPGPHTGSAEAVSLMQQIADEELPQSMATEWTDLAFLQFAAGNSAMFFFFLAVVFVFLVLAAQYESWKLPLAVILVVPMCLFCSVVGSAAGRHGSEHLHADRLRGAGGPGEQERDPDCRIRQAAAGGGGRASGGRPWRPAACGCGRS